MAQGIHSSFKPSLLTKTEIDWLLGKAHLSQSYEYKIKSIIKSKLKALYEFELPLFLKSGLFPEATNLANLRTILRPLVKPLTIIRI